MALKIANLITNICSGLIDKFSKPDFLLPIDIGKTKIVLHMNDKKKIHITFTGKVFRFRGNLVITHSSEMAKEWLVMNVENGIYCKRKVDDVTIKNEKHLVDKLS